MKYKYTSYTYNIFANIINIDYYILKLNILLSKFELKSYLVSYIYTWMKYLNY